MVQSVLLIVELPSTTLGPTLARTWTKRFLGLSLHGAPQESSRMRREEVACWILWSEHLIILRSPRSTSLGSPLVPYLGRVYHPVLHQLTHVRIIYVVF